MNNVWLICSMAIVFLLAPSALGQKQDSPRTIKLPSRYYDAEAFLALNDHDRMVYTQGLMDGFYASAFFGARDEEVHRLSTCTHTMDIFQVTAIITKYVKDNPQNWNQPLSMSAYNALNGACPK